MPEPSSPQRLGGTGDREVLAGSSATGVGAGTVIVALAHLTPEPWRETITLAAPALTLMVTGVTFWAKSRIRRARYERTREQADARMRTELEGILSDPNINAEEKERARQAYARTKLQRFDHTANQAQAPSDALDYEGMERAREGSTNEEPRTDERA